MAKSSITDAGVRLRINGSEHLLQIEPRVTLLDALREYTHLYGTKKGCDQGQCGACTVHVDGRRVLACLTLASQVEGLAITTIEGLAVNGSLHPVQEAFIRHDAFQCGHLHRLEHLFIDEHGEHALTNENSFFFRDRTVITTEE